MRDRRSPAASIRFRAGAASRIRVSTRSRVRNWSAVKFAKTFEPTELIASRRMGTRGQSQDQAPWRMLATHGSSAVQRPWDHDSLAALEPADARLRDILGARPENAGQCLGIAEVGHVDELRPDGPRAEGAHQDTAAAELGVERLREAEHERLLGGITGLHRQPLERRGPGDV